MKWLRKRKIKPEQKPTPVTDDPYVIPSTTLNDTSHVEVIALKPVRDFDPRALALEYKIPRNCRSCGAPVSYSDFKCPYCGVPYVGGDR